MGRMPVVFVGHGSPMNAIEENRFSKSWVELDARLPRPKAILSVSAHWFTQGTRVSDAETPRLVYDMYGFPEALYRVEYNAPGSPYFAGIVKEVLSEHQVQTDRTWGLDHGTWSVLRWLYPKADIPVFQLSVDRHASLTEHFAMGRLLRGLREQGVLIIGSGNIVHNLARVNWNMNGGYPWAKEFDMYIKRCVMERDDEGVIQYEKAGPAASQAFMTIDHYAPLLYVLGAAGEQDVVSVFNEEYVLGSLSMTSYLFSGRDGE